MTALPSTFWNTSDGQPVESTGSYGDFSADQVAGLFADYVASRFTSPEQILMEYFDSLQAAALSIGANIEDPLILDGAPHYLPNSNGQRDQKQGYYAEFKQCRDGVITPVVRLHSFKEGGHTWNPRDLVWHDWQADKEAGNIRTATAESIEQYNARASELKVAADAKRAVLEAEAEHGRQAAADAAQAAWDAATVAKDHPYLITKGVQSHGLRVAAQAHKARLWNRQAGEWQEVTTCRPGDLLIPLHHDGQLVNMQRIDQQGGKRFIMGGQKKGASFSIGASDSPGWIAEGYATAATVHEVTGQLAVVAFDAGNLPVVAAQFPDQVSKVAADNDDAGIKAAEATGLPHIAPPVVGMDWNDYANQEGRDAALILLQQELKPVRQPLLITPAEVFTPPPPAEWAIKGIVEHRETMMLFGPSNGGKSFIAVSMACCIATGRDWYGRKVKQGPVVYCNGEGFGGLQRRIMAWSLEAGVQPDIYPTRKSVAWGEADQLQRLSDEIAAMPQQPALIVVDTLARAAVGLEENSQKEMGIFVDAVDRMRRRHGCTVLVVHHTGHGEQSRARGSSALRAAWDVEIGLEPGKEKTAPMVIRCTKMRDHDFFDPMVFKFRSVTLPDGWIDSEGERLTSAVLDLQGDPIADTPDRKTLSEHERIALHCLKELQDKQIAELAKCGSYEPGNPPTVLKGDWYSVMQEQPAFAGKDTHRQYPSKLEKAGYVEKLGTRSSPEYRPI